jgi:ubiquitin-conjugating enzyme E2 variant
MTSNKLQSLKSTLLNDDALTNDSTATIESPEPKPLPGMKMEMMSDAKKSYLDDGFIFGLDGSGLERPKGKEASVVVEGDSLETTPQQVGIVLATFAGHSLFAANAIAQYFSQTGGNLEVTALTSLSTIIASWVIADFGSGVFHWAVDNYGNGRTPVMGSIIAAFQGHHSAPWTITYRGFCNNVWKLCIPFGIPTIGVISLLAGPENPMGEQRVDFLIQMVSLLVLTLRNVSLLYSVTLFFAVFCAIEIMSQELHKWSHMTVKETPSWVNTMQDLGITIARVPHAKHHMAPYDGNYCIVSGICNEALDESGFFRWMEHKVYEMNGVESNAWKLDPELRERTLRGQYQLQQ